MDRIDDIPALCIGMTMRGTVGYPSQFALWLSSPLLLSTIWTCWRGWLVLVPVDEAGFERAQKYVDGE